MVMCGGAYVHIMVDITQCAHAGQRINKIPLTFLHDTQNRYEWRILESYILSVSVRFFFVIN